MPLPLLNFATLTQTMSAAVQGSAKPLIDLTVGSVLRAMLESSASVALWLQWLILQVLRTTRASTSTAADLDSWVADFGVFRLPAVASSGTVTLSRLTPTLAAFVPVGSTVRTADASQLFAVTSDTSNAAFSAPLGGFTIGAGVASLAVPVAASIAGSAGNVQAGGIALLSTAIAGVDSVTNALAFQNGLDPETDPALRARFLNFINSRSRATIDAVAYAVASLARSLASVVLPSTDASGRPQPGSFTVVVDDGSGTPPSTVLTAAALAIDKIRPVGTNFAVLPPTVVPVAISLAVTVNAAANHATIASAVAVAVGSYVNALPIGAPLPVGRIAQIAFDTSPSIVNATSILLNGAAQDVIVSPVSIIKSAIITVL